MYIQFHLSLLQFVVEVGSFIPGSYMPADELKANEQFVTYVKDSIKNEAVLKFIIDNAKIK